MTFQHHCKDCGHPSFEDCRNAGSDVIPHKRCKACETVQAIACDCDDPFAHREGDA